MFSYVVFVFLCFLKARFADMPLKKEKPMMKKLILSLLALVVTGVAHAQGMKETDPAFFKTAEAQRIGDQMLIYQRVTGGWPKNIDMAKSEEFISDAVQIGVDIINNVTDGSSMAS